MANQSIYTVGGTVQAGGGIYIPRQADDQLLALCRSRTFAYVLTPRQMGKSSLMVRTAEQLQQEGVCTAIIDLQPIGAQVSPEEWYLGLLTEIEDQLDLNTDLLDWWEERTHLGLAQRMTQFFRDVVLAEVDAPIVVFIDEIDTTLSLDFTDDFFIALRYFYTARAQNPEFERLSFVLIGVATPTELIRDPHRTPFNVGERVDLTDFTLAEAIPLAAGLGVTELKAQQVLDWILDWTGGHPYLTQRLCQVVGEEIQNPKSKIQNSITQHDVERLVAATFFGGMSERDNNLQFVRDMLTQRAPDIRQVLATYKKIWLGRVPVRDTDQSVIKSHLKLSGVVTRSDGRLKTRNLIYHTVFNIKWIDSNLPADWVQNVRLAAYFSGITFLLLLVPVSIFAEYQRREAVQQRQLAEEQRQLAEAKSEEAQKLAKEALEQRRLVEELLLGGSSRVQKQNISPEVKAFLDTIAWSLNRLPANGYQLKLDGSEFDDFRDHPRARACGAFYDYVTELCADSAGRYHIISPTWDSLARRLELSDFSPLSQDLAAIELLREHGVLEELESGNFEEAVYKVSDVWVTFPDSENTRPKLGYKKKYSINQLEFMYSIFLARYE